MMSLLSSLPVNNHDEHNFYICTYVYIYIYIQYKYIYMGNSTISCSSLGEYIIIIFIIRKHSKGQNNIQEVFQNKNVCYPFFLEDGGTKHLDVFIISALCFHFCSIQVHKIYLTCINYTILERQHSNKSK